MICAAILSVVKVCGANQSWTVGAMQDPPHKLPNLGTMLPSTSKYNQVKVCDQAKSASTQFWSSSDPHIGTSSSVLPHLQYGPNQEPRPKTCYKIVMHF
jgi:hypothetical protein